MSPKGTECAPNAARNAIMPILAREVDIYPPNLLARSDLEQEATDHWWAVYTVSRHEKELMRKLIGLQIPCYCPVIPHRVRSPQGRTRTSYVPLFSNYVFVHGDAESRYKTLSTNCVSRILPVVDSAGLTRDLRQIHKLIECDEPLTVEARLQPGARVLIKSGRLAGLRGTILERNGATMLLVSVNFIQQGATVRLEDFDVEPAE